MATSLHDQLERFRARRPSPVEGTEWSYVDSGGDGPVHLLLHGGLGDAESLFSLFEPLSGTARVLAPSLPPSVETMDGAVAGLKAVLKAADAARVHVFGHSQGGCLAHAFARARPEGAASLVVSGSRLGSPVRAKALGRQLALVRRLPDAVVRAAAAAQLRRIARIDLVSLPATERSFWTGYLTQGLRTPGFKLRAESTARLQIDYHRQLRFGPEDATPWPRPCAILSYGRDVLISRADVLRMTAANPEAAHHAFEALGHLGPFMRPKLVLEQLASLAAASPGDLSQTT